MLEILLYYMGNTQRSLNMRKLAITVSMLAFGLAGCNMMAATNSQWKDAKPIAAGSNELTAFKSLEASGPDTVNFITGDGFSITATGDANEIKKLRYRLVDGVLKIGRVGSNWSMSTSDKIVTLTVKAPLLTDLSLSGSGDVTADNMQGDEVKVDLAGSGNITVNAITARNIASDLAGSGDIILAGKVTSGEHNIAGSGNLNATKLTHSKAEVSIAGSGDANLTATGTVEGSIAGSGNVNVAGGAKCTVSKVGSGEITCG
jgi:hypothetical protein